jgi:hypothetical protein
MTIRRVLLQPVQVRWMVVVVGGVLPIVIPFSSVANVAKM